MVLTYTKAQIRWVSRSYDFSGSVKIQRLQTANKQISRFWLYCRTSFERRAQIVHVAKNGYTDLKPTFAEECTKLHALRKQTDSSPKFVCIF